jgi:quinol-cytochrome oxidoreductase complex cytochrome b subunit
MTEDEVASGDRTASGGAEVPTGGATEQAAASARAPHLPGWLAAMRTSQLWRSAFRHDYADTPRNRLLQIGSNVFLHLHPAWIPRHALRLGFTWCAGGLSFLLFLVTLVTGLALMLGYRPTPQHAYLDLLGLQHAVPLGALARNIHRFGGLAMVGAVIVHLLRVFLTGSYKPPRELNWVVGVALLVLTMLMAFTGELLRWDQPGYWATRVGTELLSAAPLAGSDGPFAGLLGVTRDSDLRAVLVGSPSVDASALLRFYALHCVILPLCAATLIGLHFWRVRRDGISGPL